MEKYQLNIVCKSFIYDNCVNTGCDYVWNRLRPAKMV
jgi:hypothetical protein